MKKEYNRSPINFAGLLSSSYEYDNCFECFTQGNICKRHGELDS